MTLHFLTARQLGSLADTRMSISANILLFGETLFCQYLCITSTDLQSVKKSKNLTFSHLLDTSPSLPRKLTRVCPLSHCALST